MVCGRQARATVLAPMELDLFAACLPGLEPLLAAELTALGATPRELPGGVAFRGSRDLLLRAHLHLGTASHLLLRCATFRCLSLSELERKVAALPWGNWLSRAAVFDVEATAKKSRLYHSGAIEERVEKGIAAVLGVDLLPRASAPAAEAPTPVAPKRRQDNKPLSAAAKRGRGSNAKNPDPKWQARIAEAAKKEAEEKQRLAEQARRDAETARATLPHVSISVRFVADVATISIDTSATPLHRRGYRLDGSKAPLREDIAFAMLRAAGFAAGTPLLDPFCGSGTIAIEAAAIAAGLPPGRLRPAPLQGTAFADDAQWRAMVDAATRKIDGPIPSTPIEASDRDAGAVEATIANAERAGVRAAITARCCAVSAATWFEHPEQAPAGALVATNPPFGRRVGAVDDLLPLYQTLGHRTAKLASARAAILAHDVRLCRRTGLELRAAFTTRHGGLGVTCLVG